MPRMRGSAIIGEPFRRGSLDLDTKAPLKRIRSSVNLWFDKVFGDVRGAFLSKSKEPRRNGFPLIAEPLMRGIFEECLAVDVESL